MNHTLINDAVSAAGIAILVLDSSDQIIGSNAPAGRLLGHDPDHLMGKPISAFLAFSMAKTADGGFAHATLRSAEAASMVSGTVKSVQSISVHLVRWTDQDGNARSTVTIHDNTVMREVARIRQNELVQSDNAIRGANIGVFEYDPASQSVSISDIWRKMLEISSDEELDEQLEWRRRVHPDDLERALKPVELCVAGLAERAHCEYRLRSRDGSRWRWLRTDIAVARRDSAGLATLLVGAQTDITERKTMEEALRISVEQFRSAFENGPIGKAIVALDGSWLRVNSALCELVGYSEAEMLLTSFQVLTHPDDLEADLALLKQLTEGAIPSYTIEKRYYRSNGAILWGNLSVGMVRNAEGQPDHYISQIVDVTEQRRLEQLRSEFVSVVSHELRTPLTSILGALTLLQSYDDDILDFQKFSAHEMRFSLSRQSVAVLLEEALLANMSSSDKYNVRFTTPVLDRSLIGHIDQKRFQQVMTNLMSNAAKFADTGSTVTVSAERQGASIRIAVTNSGPGIADAFRDRVFKPFSQASSISTLRSGGTGLGLSISKQIVEQMGGEIGFESIPNAKTTFWFTVRAADLNE
jgi:PAS domain S-box-containing protein